MANGFGQLVGIGLGGAVEQANIQADRDIRERALGLQEQRMQFEQMATQRQQVFDTANNLSSVLIEAKKNSGLSNAQFSERAARSIEQTAQQLTRTSELARQNGIDMPDLGQQFLQQLEATNTATETAAIEGRGRAAGKVAEAQELVGIGIPSAQALATAGVAEADIPKFQTEAGKVIADIELATERFGEDSPQAQALQEVLSGIQSGETAPDFSDVSGLRKEFTRASEDFIATQDSFDRVKFAAENESAAGDVALIFGFMKMLDPGSTVREGEFATAQTAANVPEQVLGLYNRAVSGQRLTASQRADFFNQSKGIFRNQVQRQITREQEFGRLADSFRFPREQVIVNFREGVTPEDIRFAATTEEPAAVETAEPQQRMGNGMNLDATLGELRGLDAEQLRARLRDLPLEQRRALLERLQGGQ